MRSNPVRGGSGRGASPPGAAPRSVTPGRDRRPPEIEPASQLAPPKPGMLPTADYYLATLREGVTEINLSPRETTLMFTIPARIKDHASSLEVRVRRTRARGRPAGRES